MAKMMEKIGEKLHMGGNRTKEEEARMGTGQEVHYTGAPAAHHTPTGAYDGVGHGHTPVPPVGAAHAQQHPHQGGAMDKVKHKAKVGKERVKGGDSSSSSSSSESDGEGGRRRRTRNPGAKKKMGIF